MKTKNTLKLFLVDDDAVYLKSLEIDFQNQAGFEIETYSSGELCLQNMDRQPDLIVLDYHLDGIEKGVMNGIDTLKKIREMKPNFPVVMLSAQDKIEVAVDCMRHGAFDYVVKSETAFTRLLNIIATVFRFQKIESQLNWYMEQM